MMVHRHCFSQSGLARRFAGGDPIFAVNFPWFGTADYWAGQVVLLQDQVEALREDPLVA